MKTSKLYIRVDPEFDKKFTFWAKTLGVTKSQLGNLTLQSGLTRFVKTIRGEDALEDEDVKLVKDIESIQGSGRSGR